MKSPKRLLIIEDDLNLVLTLYRALSHTYKVDTAKSAASGIKKAETLLLDLIILDLNLPDQSGLKVIRHLRDIGINTPILILSGQTDLTSKVDLLDNGANDYVTKPFSLSELKARIRVHLRYSTNYPVQAELISGSLKLDPRTRQVVRDGVPIDLRKKEYALLECLLRNAGTAITRAYLSDYVWGVQQTVRTNSIDVHINSLRDKLDRNYEKQLIKTVHGLGYIIDTTKPKARIN